MNKFLYLFVLALALPLSASAERIADYTVHIELTKSGVAVVQEEITYDFGEAQRHGIFREIPLLFTLPNKEERSISITDLSVRDKEGKELPNTVSGGGNYVEVKIGDPDVFVTGEVLYVIRYEVLGATFVSTGGHEFYWNAVGQDWSVPIDRVRLQVALPRTLPREQVLYGCYQGGRGSVTPCEEGFLEGVATDTVTMLRFLSTDLPPKGGVTFSVALPAEELGVNDVPTNTTTTSSKNVGWMDIFFAALLPIAVLFIMLRKWKEEGDDPDGQGTIIAEHVAPENLDPLMISYLSSLRVSHEAITAMIVSLAQRGYLRIDTKEESIILGLGKTTKIDFTSLDKDRGKLFDYEIFILETMFASGKDVVSQEDLGRKLVVLPQKLPGMLSQHAVDLGYYEKDPTKTRNTYVVGGVCLMIFSPILLARPHLALSLVVTGLIVAIVGYFMPKATPKGVLTIDKIKGFKEYLSIAEKDRIAFHSDPKNDRAIYEELLPYAMALGLGSVWLKWFNEFYQNPNEQPTWITHQGTSAFAMSDVISRVNIELGTSMTATSSGGSGGGFSGGGGGGGGGGSW